MLVTERSGAICSNTATIQSNNKCRLLMTKTKPDRVSAGRTLTVKAARLGHSVSGRLSSFATLQFESRAINRRYSEGVRIGENMRCGILGGKNRHHSVQVWPLDSQVGITPQNVTFRRLVVVVGRLVQEFRVVLEREEPMAKPFRNP